MTWLLGIKIYALCSLLFSVGWAVVGCRHNKRRERNGSVISVRCGEVVVFPEPIQPIIRADGELIL